MEDQLQEIAKKWSKRQEVARDAYGGQVISTVVDVGEGRFKF